MYPQDLVFSSGIGGIDDNGFPSFQHNSNHQPHKLLPAAAAFSSSPACNSSSTDALLLSSVDFFHYLATELQKQTAQIDSCLQIQNEKLSMVVQEETMQRGMVLQRYALKLMSMIEHKENDLALAKMRRMQLQQILISSNMESKAWESKALENESSVINLTNKIKQLQQNIHSSRNAVRDEESCCGSSPSSPSSIMNKKKCKACDAQSTCVIFFPCRHLCCCKACDAHLLFCPICQTVKEESMEILLG